MKNITTKLLQIITIFLFATFALAAQHESSRQQFDISNIPEQYQADFENTLNSWMNVQKKEQDFYKALGYEIYGDNRPFGLQMMDSTLVYFSYPWALNTQYPFATTHNTPYFSHYHPIRKSENVNQIEGNLDAVIADGLNYEDYKAGNKPIRIHLKKEVGETTLFLSAEANADWSVTWEEGVKIKQIIVPNDKEQFRIKTQAPLDKKILSLDRRINRYAEWGEVSVQSTKLSAMGWNFYQKFSNNIQNVLGHKPRSISFAKETSHVEVNGKDWSENYAKEAHLTGLWYWESAGVIDAKNPAIYGINLSYAHFPYKLKQVIKDGDVLQFALDKNNSNFYIGLNGEWIVGNPAYSGSGIRLEPQLVEDWGDKAGYYNFGSTPFKYKAPNGYQPYNTQTKQSGVNNTKLYLLKGADFDLPKFPEKRYQRSSKRFRNAWGEFLKAIVEYRTNACALTYAYRHNAKVSPNNLDAQCVWYIKGLLNEGMEFPTRELLNSYGRAGN